MEESFRELDPGAVNADETKVSVQPRRKWLKPGQGRARSYET